MKVIKADGMYKVARISGPTHQYLGAVVVLSKPETIRVLARHHRDESPLVDEAALLECVKAVVALTNETAGREVFIECVEYVRSDTPDYRAYAELVAAILSAASGDLLDRPVKPVGSSV